MQHLYPFDTAEYGHLTWDRALEMENKQGDYYEAMNYGLFQEVEEGIVCDNQWKDKLGLRRRPKPDSDQSEKESREEDLCSEGDSWFGSPKTQGATESGQFAGSTGVDVNSSTQAPPSDPAKMPSSPDTTKSMAALVVGESSSHTEPDSEAEVGFP